MTLFRKNVILKDYKWRPVGIEGLEVLNRKEENNENYVSLMGTKQQINKYLQEMPVISDRLRTLKNVPHYRLISSHKVRIQ